MTQIIQKDIINAFKDNDINVLIHQANCFHTMGAGIAKKLKLNFPEVYQADRETKYGDINKLGTFSYCNLNNKYIINLYSQFRYGRETRHTNYEAMKLGFKSIHEQCLIWNAIQPIKIGIPFNIGCNNAGGEWSEVSQIISNEFNNSILSLNIYKI